MSGRVGVHREHHYCRCGGALHLASDRDTVAGIAATWWAFHTGSRHGLASQAQASAARRRLSRLEQQGRRGG